LGGDIVYGNGEGCRCVGIRHIRAAGFAAGHNPEGVVDHERQVGGNKARDWYSQECGLYIYMDMSDAKKSRTQIYMDLSYIHPQARVLNYCYK